MSNTRSHEDGPGMNDILASTGVGSFPPKLHHHNHHAHHVGPAHHGPPAPPQHHHLHHYANAPPTTGGPTPTSNNNTNNTLAFGPSSNLTFAGLSPGGGSSMLPNDDLFPMVRSMSDASDFKRPTNIGQRTRPMAALSFGAPTASSGVPPGFTNFPSTSSGISEGTDISFRRSNSNNFQLSSGCEEDEYDLHMIFDEIDALQNKCTDEDAESQDIVTPLTNIAQGMTHVYGGANGEPGKAPTGEQAANLTQSDNLGVRRKATVTTADGKTITYNPELYDEKDILLSAEQYSSNVRYLRDFRCEQCPLFLQHKCNQHKPFTCFHWHFANQRRRRPLRKRDGTFNYSPDSYCSKYDETTGLCPDGDECLNLHRTAGDTERRYHLRYYKTGMCIYETDSRGFCVKNGAHCAFAHNQNDLRLAVLDIREQTAAQDGDPDGPNGPHPHYEKDRNALNEDPRWQDIAFVLAHYKTEFCKRPQRLCRQGYACPQYHNNKDRRRSPKSFKYRSTPCPSVKTGDEWGDPSKCEQEDNCQFCHTRTEQQFHPEIYKSNKCNDIKDSPHCPRGPFCAFAHNESIDQINNARDFATDPNTEFPPAPQNSTSPLQIGRANSMSAFNRAQFAMQQSVPSSLPDHFDMSKLSHDLPGPVPPSIRQPPQQQQPQTPQSSANDDPLNLSGGSGGLGPIARPRSYSTSNTKSMQPVTLQMLLNEKQKMGRGNSVAKKAIGQNMFGPNSVFPTVPEQNSFGMNSFGFEHELNDNPGRNPLDELTMDHFESQLSGSLGFGPSGNQGDDSMSSMFRRGSLLNNDNSSSPINIPDVRHLDGRYHESSGRSASAVGFNHSPPGVIGTSPLDSSFASFGSRAQQTSPQSAFDQAAQIRTLKAHLQRDQEKIQLLEKQVHYGEQKLLSVIQQFKGVVDEGKEKDRVNEQIRTEAFERLSAMKKEMEWNNSIHNHNAFQNHAFNDMSRHQLLLLQQKLAHDLKTVEDLLKNSNL